MKKIIAIGGVVFALVGAMAQSVTVNVLSSSIFINSGLYITNGEPITINANGNWTYASTVNGIYDSVFGEGSVPDGVFDGSSDIFFDNGIQGSLVAFIGGDNPYMNSFTYPQETGFWEIGSCRQFISNTNGWLWLGVQDDANSHNSSDNDGSVNAQIFTGYGSTNSDWKDIRPVVIPTLVSPTEFGFSITATNLTNSFWAVYDSADLKNWVLVGAVTLDDNGLGSFVNTTATPYRFYKVSNGQTTSKVIGFEQIEVPAFSTNFIANQLDNTNSADTFDDLFNPMADGTTMPGGVSLQTYSGSSYTDYTWTGTAWSPNGNATLAPGEGAMLCNPTGTNFVVTFAGLVREGELTIPLTGGANNLVSSMLPQAGGIKSVLGFNPGLDDSVLKWNGDTFTSFQYDPINLDPYGSPTGWTDGGGNPAVEPVINVGESFFIVPGSSGESWTRYFQPYP